MLADREDRILKSIIGHLEEEKKMADAQENGCMSNQPSPMCEDEDNSEFTVKGLDDLEMEAMAESWRWIRDFNHDTRRRILSWLQMKHTDLSAPRKDVV